MNDEVDKQLKEFTDQIDGEENKSRTALQLLTDINKVIKDYRFMRHFPSSPDEIDMSITFKKEMTPMYDQTYVYANYISMTVKTRRCIYGQFFVDGQFTLKVSDLTVNKMRSIIKEDSYKLKDIERAMSIIQGEEYSVSKFQ